MTVKAEATATATEAEGTVLTTPAETKVETKVEETSPETKTEETKTSETAKPALPEKYELKAPEGVQVSAETLEKVALFAKEQGLTQDQAQKVFERQIQAEADLVSAQQAKLQEEASKWMDQLKGDKEIGGDSLKENVEHAKRVVEKYGSDAFKETLNKTGLGNHPELVRVFARIGKQMAEDQLVMPGKESGKAQVDPAEVLFGPRK